MTCTGNAPTLCTLRALLGLLVLWGCGCGGGDDDAVGGGEVSAPWDAYCVATFTEDYAFIDPFDDVELRVEQGGRYLMSSFGDFGAAATVLFLADAGPVDFDVDVETGAALPFTTNCTEGAVQDLVGVFADVTVYSDEALTMEACRLTAGTALPGGGLNQALASGDFFGQGTYEISFTGLADACAGLTTGYVEASAVMIGHTEYTVVPLASVIGPRP